MHYKTPHNLAHWLKRRFCKIFWAVHRHVWFWNLLNIVIIWSLFCGPVSLGNIWRDAHPKNKLMSNIVSEPNIGREKLLCDRLLLFFFCRLTNGLNLKRFYPTGLIHPSELARRANVYTDHRLVGKMGLSILPKVTLTCSRGVWHQALCFLIARHLLSSPSHSHPFWSALFLSKTFML